MTVSFIVLALGILPYIPNQEFVELIILSFMVAFTMFKIASKRDPGIIRKNN
jgi:palmitoyltransferase ZDHHC13/17